MKILLLACLTKNKSGNSYGGAEKSIINMANWLSRKGYDVTLASVEGSEKTFFIDEGVKFKGYDIKKGNKIYIHYQIYMNTQRAINECKPDVIVGFWIHPMFYSIFNSYTKKVIKIYSERNDPSLEYGKISKLLRWVVMKNCTGIVFQTSEAKEYFNKKICRKSKIIHNPVYITEDQYVIKENRIVAVGRLNEQKNFRLLIDAFNQVKDECPNAIVEIYGEGPLRDSLKKQIELNDLENRVFLMGAYPDVLDRIYGARLFVLSSNYEGMPNALMEAMCLGIPVLSSDCPCGGPRELIIDGKNGFLFTTRNKDELAMKIRDIYNCHDLQDLIKYEKQICATHSEEKIFSKWVEYIKELVKKDGI